jgi:hypothetical protein
VGDVRLAVGALLLGVGLASSAFADEGETPPDQTKQIEQLRQQVERHDADIARLSVVHFSGYVQVDGVAYNQLSQDEVDPSTGRPLNQTRFLLRRGHLRADVDQGLVLGTLEIDANTMNGPQVRPIDAEASVRWPPRKGEDVPIVMGTLGLMKIPFGFEVPELDYVRPFLERAAVVRALFPGEFDLGFRLKGGNHFLSYALALMNGHPIGESTFPAVDPAGAKDLVGRIGIDTKVTEAVAVSGGVSGVTGTGFHKGTPATKDVLVWRDANQDGVVQPNEIQVIPGEAATSSQTFHRFALGIDLRVRAAIPHLGELVVRSEILWGSNLDRGIEPADPVGAGRDLRELGWYAGLTQELGPYAMLGARYDVYDPDADASEQQGASLVPRDRTYTTLALMGMAHLGLHRIVAEYDHNTNPLGRNAGGAPTTLASDALTLRGQVVF